VRLGKLILIDEANQLKMGESLEKLRGLVRHTARGKIVLAGTDILAKRLVEARVAGLSDPSCASAFRCKKVLMRAIN